MKKILAIAIAAMGVSMAHAETSNVTVYGVMDAYVGNVNDKDSNRTTGVQSGGLSESRFGLKGVEDLGSGLKANFKLEVGPVAFDNGTGLNTLREGYVGLSHAQLGSLKAGTVLSPAADWAYRFNPLAGSAFDPLNRAQDIGFGVRANDRLVNGVSYAAPSIYGVTAQAALAATGEGPTAATRQTVGVVSADWAHGPLAVGAVYRDGEQAATLSVPAHHLREFGIGASYVLPQVKLSATYQQGRSSVNGSSIDRLTGISAVVPVNARDNVIGAVSYLNVGGSQESVTTYTVAYTRELSKRTTVYGAVTRVDQNPDNAYWANGIGAGLRVAF